MESSGLDYFNGKYSALHLRNRLTNTNYTRLHDFRIDPAQIELATSSLVHEHDCIGAIVLSKLAASGMRVGGNLDDRRADRKTRSWRHVFIADIQVDVK